MKVVKLSLPPGTLERVSQQSIQQVLRYITWKQKCLPHGGATGNIRGWGGAWVVKAPERGECHEAQ